MIYLGEQLVSVILPKEPVAELQLGPVRNIRYTNIDGNLVLKFTDPDDTYINGQLIAKFLSNTLVYKRYTTLDESGNERIVTLDMFPQNINDRYRTSEDTSDNKEEDDGIALTETVRNTYDVSAFRKKLYQEYIYCFRFFPESSTGQISEQTQFPSDNIFSTVEQTWDSIALLLENYDKNYSESESASLLLHPGGEAYVNYIYDDRIAESPRTVLTTRSEVLDKLATNPSSVVSAPIPFTVLGYNGNVPQYIKYVKEDENGNIIDRKWISSVDDTHTSYKFKFKGHNIETQKVLVGDMCYRNDYSVGHLRVYNRIFNSSTLKNEFEYIGIETDSTSFDTEKFTYGTEPNHYITVNTVSVPKKIVISGSTYRFAGYTMTLHSKAVLTDYTSGSAVYGTQFDAPEMQYASALNYYDSTSHYFYFNDGVYNEIDVEGEHLIGKPTYYYSVNGEIINGNVYKLTDDNRLELDTQIYSRYYTYYDSGSIDPEIISSVVPFAAYTIYNTDDYVSFGGVIYKVLKPTTGSVTPRDTSYFSRVGTNTALTRIYHFAQKTAYTVGSYVWTNETGTDKIYSVIKATTASYTGTPSTDTSTFTEITQPLSSYMVDKVIENVNVIVANDSNRVNYGNNIYDESFIRQYLNSSYGSRDIWWKPLNRFDVQSFSGIGIRNGNILKFAKSSDFLRNITPAANICKYNNTAINNKWKQYKTIGNCANSSVVCDTMFQLAMKEANFAPETSLTDSIVCYSDVYRTDAGARIKYILHSDGSVHPSTKSIWWSRSPYLGRTLHVWYVTTFDTQSSNFAYNSYGFAPACIIG